MSFRLIKGKQVKLVKGHEEDNLLSSFCKEEVKNEKDKSDKERKCKMPEKREDN